MDMRSIAIIGAGHVGLVSGTCLSELGNTVICADDDAPKIARLRAGDVPFFEPGLGEMIVRNVQARRLSFTTDVARAILESEVIFISVGTPLRADGAIELGAVGAVAREIGLAIDGPRIVVSKSTVPVETGELISSIIREHAPAGCRVSVVSNPEFLREGSAIADFLTPDRVVIGTDDPVAIAVMRDLYAPLDVPVLVTNARTAEMIKYASNAFLATKISFVNEIANICELLGVDVKVVCQGIGYDRRIGTKFMSPGIGYGGSCFPKDVRGLAQMAAKHGYPAPLLHAVESVNRRQIEQTIGRIEHELGGLDGRTVAVLGLAFKPNTDDTRGSPALALIRALLDRGASVRAHDPVAVEAACAALDDPRVAFFDDMYAAVAAADAVLLATEWNEFRTLDFARCAAAMRGNLILDGRNVFDAEKVRAANLRYAGIGRGGVRGMRPQAAAVDDVSRDQPTP